MTSSTQSPGTRAGTVRLPAVPAAPGPRRTVVRQLGVDTGYALASFPVALAAFVVVVPGLSLGVGLLVVWVGVAVLALTLVAARGLATAERAWLPAVLRRELPRPVYRRAEGSALRRLLTPLRDAQCWLDALHAVVRLPFAILSFGVTVAFWAGALGGLTWAAWGWALPDGPDDQDLPELLGFGDGYAVRVAFHAALGLLLALLLPVVVRGVAVLQAQVGRALLTSRAAAQEQVERATRGRDAAVAAEAVALRRLERDIHDGPQQHLVRLGMDLARAQRQLDRDPAAARSTLGEAAGLAREALEELRALSRGIAPPVLADRGLAAALAALAARPPVPVELSVDLPGERLAPAVENTAYFVVSEALANVAKHSGASVCRVAVSRADGGLLRVVVEDDGHGGAVAAPGHGLAGLADRLRAADGTLAVDSPRGGPTRLTAEVPGA
ncbi:sensor histidine kinase [Trujillonella humicola]|uniref:sensor histidine kinase n=1 Tax=Trujillonella humicola TaxID=3383699 RepID=UPI0039063551